MSQCVCVCVCVCVYGYLLWLCVCDSKDYFIKLAGTSNCLHVHSIDIRGRTSTTHTYSLSSSPQGEEKGLVHRIWCSALQESRDLDTCLLTNLHSCLDYTFLWMLCPLNHSDSKSTNLVSDCCLCDATLYISFWIPMLTTIRESDQLALSLIIFTLRACARG